MVRDDRRLMVVVSELSSLARQDGAMRRILLALTLALAVAPASADGGRAHDDDDLHEARRHGEVMPLAELLELVRPAIGGEILDIEFKRKGDRIHYEIYFLDGQGRRREAEVDARTGEILEDDD